MLPGRGYRHSHARIALVILLAALLPLAAVAPDSPVPTSPASPGAGKASRSGHAGAAALQPAGDTADVAPWGLSRSRHGVDHDGLWQAEEWLVRQRAYPLKGIPGGARLRALAQLAALRRLRTHVHAAAMPAPMGVWQHVGPPAQQTNGTSTVTFSTTQGLTTVAGATNYGVVGGRVTALAVAPASANTLYAGTAGGGVWKSTDGGATWTATTDAQPSLAIGALAIAPTPPYTLYAMTGEGNNSIDSYYGAGLLESSDGGGHWTRSDAGLGALSSSRLVIDPNTPSILYASMDPDPLALGLTDTGGIYRSTDGGATWTPSLAPSAPAAGGCKGASFLTPWVPGTDVAVASTSGVTTVYAALGASFGCTANGIYRSADNGQTWTRLRGFDAVAGTTIIAPSSGTTNVGRIALATAPSNPSVVYAAVQNVSGGTLQGVYESTDGGTTWAALAHPNDLGPENRPANQYWYDLYVAVDPTISSTVYLGGEDIFKSTTSGTTWTNLTNSYNGGAVHPDQHALVFGPGGVMYAGNDGGVYETTNAGATWMDLNTGLDAIQLYGASVSTPAQGTLIYRGAQDNGVSRYDGAGPWTSAIDGDGTLSAIDPTNATIAYVGTTGGLLFKTADGGNTWTLLTGTGGPNDPAGDSRLDAVTPMALDQTNPSRLLVGTYRLWESADAGATWHVPGNGRDLTGGGAYNAISALAIAPGAPSTVYVGTTNGHVQVTTNDGSSWTDGAGLPNRYVTSIAVSPASAGLAWAALSGFDEATPLRPGHVFQTSDGGHTWQNRSGNLPDVPVNALAVDPTTGALYAGTDVGVLLSSDGTTWAPLGSGLPNAPVFGLTLRADGVLYAATHGRGLWSLQVDTGTPPANTPMPTGTSTAIPTGTNTPVPTGTTAPTGTSTPVPAHSTMPIATHTSTAVPTGTNVSRLASTATPAPTSANTLPASTPAPPTNTPATGMPAATATGQPTRQITHRVGLSLTIRLVQRSVAVGDMLALRISTAPHARVSVTVQVVTTTVAVKGKGKHRKRVVRAVVLYRARFQGTANGHGQFSSNVRIAYKTAGPAQARLIVDVRMARRVASRTVVLTLLPWHRQYRRHGAA